MNPLRSLSAVVLALCCPLPAYSATVTIYADSLTSDWQDWSWSTTRSFNNTNPVYGGSGRSISVDYTSAWAGLYLHRATPVDISLGGTLQFVMHGGTTGGHRLRVIPYDQNGTALPAVAVPLTVANSWTTVGIPLASLGAAQIIALTWQDATGSNQPVYYLDAIQLVINDPPPVDMEVAVTVDTAQAIRAFPLEGLGIHTSVYDNQMSHPDVPGLLLAAGVNTLRYPGGSYSDIYQWSTHTSHGGYQATGSDFGSFIRLLDAINGRAVITVNYGSSFHDTMGGQPKEAAAWVAYANGDAGIYGTPNDIPIGLDAEGNDWRTVGYWARLRTLTAAQNPDNQYDGLAIGRGVPVGIRYWEVGNEIFGNGYYGGSGWEHDMHYPGSSGRDHNPLLGPTAYRQNFNDFVAAMKAVDPTIRVGAVLNTPPMDDSWGPDWIPEVLAQAGETADFVIVHWYAGPYQTTDHAYLLSLPRVQILQIVAELRARLDAARADDGSGVEIFVTELGPNGGTVNDPTQIVSALFCADTYISFIEAGASNLDWLELHNGTFLREFNPTNALGPAYHGIKMVHHLAAPEDTLVASTTSNNLLRVHAAQRADGQIAILMLNLSPVNNALVTADVLNRPLLVSGTRFKYGSGDAAVSQTPLGTLGNHFTLTVPPYTMYTLVIPPALVRADLDRDADVDGDDLALFAACMTGSEIPYDPAALPPDCTLAPDGDGRITVDFDEDGDLDQSDFGVFQRCLSGATVPADPNCDG